MNITRSDEIAATRTVFGEARGESPEGQIAVAWVIRNRAALAFHVWGGSMLPNGQPIPEEQAS